MILSKPLSDVHYATATIIMPANSPYNGFTPVDFTGLAIAIQEIIQNNDDCIRSGISINITLGMTAFKNSHDKSITFSACMGGSDKFHEKLWKESFILIIRKLMHKIQTEYNVVVAIDGEGTLLEIS